MVFGPVIVIEVVDVLTTLSCEFAWFVMFVSVQANDVVLANAGIDDTVAVDGLADVKAT